MTPGRQATRDSIRPQRQCITNWPLALARSQRDTGRLAELPFRPAAKVCVVSPDY